MEDVIDTTRTFSIGELARLAGVSVHTLRWYEAEGLFPRDVPRTSGGRRVYAHDSLAWLALLARLRESGAPIAMLREYAALVRAGSGNEAERLALLRAHERSLDAQIETLIACRQVVSAKAGAYQEALLARGLL
ncbi:MerR family transcriptional regulator [Microbacterium sp. CGR1]|uniref:MerR family transcriptional regulator n=1 Tax=Microbacterium sp. CGR1 TaxID=1696072 RepID=UPI00069D54A2|nr:MerR family transcriptional regulator [Microbacterium sp. CGR1]